MRAVAADAEARQLVDASQRAWIARRDAEVAFYRRALKAQSGEQAVAREATAALARRRVENLQERLTP
ncbi:lysozyme inhibitor LprI family protein [Chondromyces apiculatus]|uniref:lysozyme inhibitor LprI family protein n=1 Tax=Chondromyces apiculatus TaxID=51 RepID=UPI0018CC2917|nr:lysozyme inhibitor LprI family protein [Chondromyces apiculatus]